MISNIFIERPRLAFVVSIVITLAGLIAMRFIPVAQFPDIVPPQVQVSATFLGASAEVVQSWNGFAFIANSPRRIASRGTPTTWTIPSASSRSPSAHSKCSAASRKIFCRTTFAASFTALPATTAPRLANVPAPQ